MASHIAKEDTASHATPIVEDDLKGGHAVFETGSQTSSEPDVSRHKGTFETINNESFYRPIDIYEGIHRYDPKLQWEPNEEKRLVRKVGRLDLHQLSLRNHQSPLTQRPVGREDLLLGLSYVLRPAIGPWQHHSSFGR